MKNQLFHIAGGGIAGLASALAVAGSGNSALVMEKAVKFETVGAGLQLGPNAVRALQQLGAWDAVKPITSSPPEIIMRDGRTGKILQRIALGKKFEDRFGAPYRVAHRADLLQALFDVAKSKTNITIQTNAEVIARDAFEGFALIAADGIWSKTRDVLFPGHAANISKDVIHRSLTDETINDCVNLWFYPGGHVVHYPVGYPSKLNLVAVSQGLDVNSHYQNACDELRSILSNKSWSQWPAAYVPPLKKWNQENILLIGDAAHGTLPYMAQGAAMALEDAAELGAIVNLELVPELAFEKLFLLRSKRTQKLHAASLRAGQIYHSNGLIAAARNVALQMSPSQLFLQQLAWLYD
jgi:salicylate hydroxylase